MNRLKHWIPTGVLLLVVAAMLQHGPIAQSAHYHAFADARALLGMPNAADVISNLGFALVGAWGLYALANSRHRAGPAGSRAGYGLFFAALVMTALGSGFYHLAPDNGRLVWDRLPIALACAGLLAAVHAETHARRSRWILPALAAAGVASVLWWSFTESIGTGDLRPYLLIQGAPLLLIPIWQAIHGSPRTERWAFAVAIALYALAKVAELADHRIYEALGIVSGHTLKHVLAFAAAAVITASVARRARDAGPGSEAARTPGWPEATRNLPG